MTVDELALRVARSCRRLESATRGSPEWDAAMAEFEELNVLTTRVRHRSPARQVPPERQPARGPGTAH